MGPLHPIVLHHAIIKSRLRVSAKGKVHARTSPLKTGGVGHELRGAHGLDLLEELEGAARDLLTWLETLPGILSLASAQHELVVLDLAVLAKVHGSCSQGRSSQGNLLNCQLLLGGKPQIFG